MLPTSPSHTKIQCSIKSYLSWVFLSNINSWVTRTTYLETSFTRKLRHFNEMMLKLLLSRGPFTYILYMWIRYFILLQGRKMVLSNQREASTKVRTYFRNNIYQTNCMIRIYRQTWYFLDCMQGLLGIQKYFISIFSSISVSRVTSTGADLAIFGIGIGMKVRQNLVVGCIGMFRGIIFRII